MKLSISEVLGVLASRGILPYSDEPLIEIPEDEIEFPEIGDLEENETVYRTSLNEVFGNSNGELDFPLSDDPRLREWWDGIKRIIDSEEAKIAEKAKKRHLGQGPAAPEPHCAWYCPIHYFGSSWGIYIREDCILSIAKDIACEVDWGKVKLSHHMIQAELLRCAFYVFFLHEQFHHKVESLGFRLLVSTATDRYRPYKSKVYRPSYLSKDCLEESLANADSYKRLSEPRFTKRISSPIRTGLREFMRTSFKMQPPGYKQALDYLSPAKFQAGLYKLQSQMLDGALVPSTPLTDWALATNMIKSLMNIEDDIFVVLPIGARPIFNPTALDPGITTSSRNLVSALQKHFGYKVIPGRGKGSHIWLEKSGLPPITVPANRPTLSPKVIKDALQAIGNYPLSKLPDLLSGRLREAMA